MEVENPSTKQKEEVKIISSEQNIPAPKTGIQTQPEKDKNSIQVAIDFEKDKSNLHINIHTIVNGKVKETFNVPFSPCRTSFPHMWKDIGDEIERHMRNNPEYYPFGS